MRKVIIVSSLFLGLLWLAPTGVEAQNKNKKTNPNATVAEEEDYKALAQYPDVMAKITYIENTSKMLGVRVEYQKKMLKAGDSDQAKQQAQQQYVLLQGQVQQLQNKMQLQQQQWQNQINSIMTSNPKTRQQKLNTLNTKMQYQQQQDQVKLQQLMNKMNNFYKTVTATIDFELQPVDDVKVAMTKLPVEYDDKGKVIEYKGEELKKRKDPNIAGAYKAKFEDLQEGQSVKLYLLKPKAKKKDSKDAKSTKDSKDAKDTKGADEIPGLELAKDAKGSKDGKGAEEHPKVRMILIYTEQDPNPLAQPAGGGKKKKNNQ